MNELVRNLEAVLFYTGRPVMKKTLKKILEISDQDLDSAISHLQISLNGRGIQLLIHPDSLQLVTSPMALEIIKKIRGDQKPKSLSRSSLETLALILYKPGITKNQIDEIRGVNSSVSLRQLFIKGLIKKDRSIDKDNICLIPTSFAMRTLGITDLKDLPKQAEFMEIFKNTDYKIENEN